MYIERKYSCQAGHFWLIVFHDKNDKRDTLNELRLVGQYLSKQGKQTLYSLIRKISARCEHNDKYQKGEELASCIFKSDIDDILVLIFVFASIMKDTGELYDGLKYICDRWQCMYDNQKCQCDEKENEYKKIINEQNTVISKQNKIIDRCNEINCSQSFLLDYYKYKYGEVNETELKEYVQKHCQ